MRAHALFLIVTAATLLGGCAAGPSALVLSGAEKTSSATLVEGDAAPPLAVAEWVRGEPVAAFKPGMVYVVDFWATWCGPCLASMPRTSRLQGRTRGRVTVIGLTTLDEDNSAGKVRSLVRRNPDDIMFTVAIDAGDTTARRYRAAARDTALPRSFVIDQAGRIAWYGHPMDLDPVIDAVLGGTWDIQEARRQGQRREEARLESQIIVRDYLAADDKDHAAQLACAERAIRIPVKFMTAMCPAYWGWTHRVGALAALGRTDEARRAAAEAAETPGVREEHAAMAELAQAVKPASLDDAERYADRALQLVAQFEARTPADEWERYLADGERERMAYTRIRAADVLAARGRAREASGLMRQAIQEWPDGDRVVPSKSELKRRLAGYEGRVGVGS